MATMKYAVLSALLFLTSVGHARANQIIERYAQPSGEQIEEGLKLAKRECDAYRSG